MTIKANRREVLNAALQGAGVAVLAACGLSAVVKDARSQGFAHAAARRQRRLRR